MARRVSFILLQLAFSGALAVSGCTHSQTAATPAGDVATITQDQIVLLHASNAYDVVAATHGNFLHSRGRESQRPDVPAIPAHVYVDDTYYGDVDSLRQIGIQDIEEIRLFQSYQAQYKFGSGHPGGVIQVITKR